MPQPLSQVRPRTQIAVDALYVLNYPEFATQVMRVVAHWAHIDGNLASTLSLMMKADVATGAAMYTALNGADARKAALLAAAKEALPEHLYVVLRAVLKATAFSRSQRNEFVHHVWGVADQLPDALLLLHPNVVLAVNVSHRQRIEILPDGRGVIAPKDYDYSKIAVYRANDFQKAVEDASESEELFKGLYRLVKTQGEEELRWLLRVPRIQQALQPLILESSPATRRKLRPPSERKNRRA